MLIRRCVWHREYHGYPILYGVASWRGWPLRFSDGLCRRCARTARAQWNIPLVERPRRRRVRLDALTLTASVLLLLVATRALDDRDAMRLRRHEARTAKPAVTREAEPPAPPAMTAGMASPALPSQPPAPLRHVTPRPALASPRPTRPVASEMNARPLRIVRVFTRAGGATAPGRAVRLAAVDGHVTMRPYDVDRSFARPPGPHDEVAEALRLAQAP